MAKRWLESDTLFDASDGLGEASAGSVISRLQPTARDPSRLSVMVNGRRVATLPARCMHELDLHVGMAWTPEVQARVQQAAAQDEVHRQAMRLLNRRAVSTGEMMDRLVRRIGADAGVAEQVVADLVRLGLLDDELYGRSVLRELTAGGRKPAGALLMRNKLRQRRLDPSLIDRLVSEVLVGSDPESEMAALIEVRMRRLEGLDTATRYRRLYSYLARRGFEPERITAVLKSRLSEDGKWHG